MTPPHALLLESVHTSAHDELARVGIPATAQRKALEGEALVDALRGLGSGAKLLGLRSKSRARAELFAAVPELCAIGAFCIGTDQIDLEAARRSGVAVFNAPFSSTRSVAELVLCEVIALSRQLFARSAAAHRGVWDKSADGSHEVRGKTLGIVGYGHIGSQLSVLAEALGMRVIYYDVVTKLPLGNARAVVSLADLLRESDVVTLHVPDTEATRGMMGAAEIAAMRAGSHLVNASRGTVVDIDALAEAIRSGHLAGAAVDVFPREPAATDEIFESPLRGLERVILSPHVGGSTLEAQENIGREVATALGAFIRVGRTSGSVNLPHLDVPLAPGRVRVVNIHRNEPGVLSAINAVVAGSGTNIAGQQLATLADVGLLFVDLEMSPSDPRAHELAAAIGALEPSLRTRLVGG